MGFHAPGGTLSFVTKTMTYTGATNLGAVGNANIFNITGRVIVVALSAYCTTSLGEAAPGSATISLGVTSSTALFIPATTALDIDANEFWLDTTPDAFGLALPATLKDIVIFGVTSDNWITNQVATAAINAGVIVYECWWMPLSANGNLTPS